ncbi:MAG: hypothetical protein LBU34_06255 [Planctomycetaceae bacterium]|nr:hypothetical protein [Planctomycetaceae bacterium]
MRSYVDISKIKGTDYYWVDFGAIALRPHHNIYFVPAEQAQVNEIYVDRIFLIRTNSQEPPCIHGEYQPKTWILEKIAEGRLARNSGFRFRIKQSGKETFSISDNCASDRRTVMMPSELNCRSIRIPLKKYLTAIPSSADSSSKYKIFASVCCAVQSTVGPALSFGVFDSVTNKDIIIKTVPVVQVGNHPWGNQSYSWVELDPIALKPQNDVWFAPPGKKGNVMNIYVDKIVLVHCKTKN